MQRVLAGRAVALGTRSRDINQGRLESDLRDRMNDLSGQVFEVDTPASADTRFGILHPELGRKCTQFEILKQRKPGRLYRTEPQLWTKRVSFFKYDQAGDRIVVRLR